MRLLRILRAVLREIFDEASYERFCARESVCADRVSYAKFLSEEEVRRDKKVRCC
jgi:hypothetical protein